MPISPPIGPPFPDITLRMDLTGTAFGQSGVFTDYTSHLETGADGGPVSITYGRHDEQSDPAPATCTFLLNNPTGQWTPGNAAAPAGWRLGALVHFRLTVTATPYERFVGYVDSIEPAFPGNNWSVVTVTCSDGLGRITQILKPLRTMYEHEVLTDNPAALYMCTETTDAGGKVRDVSPNRQADGVLNGGSGQDEERFDQGAVGWLGVRAVWDDVGSLLLTKNVTDATKAADLKLPTGLLGNYPWSVEMEISLQNVGSIGGEWILGTFNDAGEYGVALTHPFTPVGQMVLTVKRDDGSSVQLAGPSLPLFDRAYLAFGVEADGLTMWITVNNTTTSGVAGAVLTTTRQLGYYTMVGANPTGYAADRNASSLLVGGIAFHPGVALSATRRAEHLRAGVHVFEATDSRWARLCRYVGLGALMGTLPVTGRSIGPQKVNGRGALDVLREVARTHGEPAYWARDGAITYKPIRDRINQPVALTLSADDVDPSLSTRHDWQGMTNELRASTWYRDLTQVATDAGSQTSFGVFDGGGFEIAPELVGDGQDLIDWLVGSRKDPQTRIPDVSIDLLTSSDTIRAGCLALDMGDKIQVTALPTQAPSAAMTVFVEGWTETFGVGEWRMGLFTSPLTIEDQMFTLDSATYGVLNDDRLGY